jgi:hypothetical protein
MSDECSYDILETKDNETLLKTVKYLEKFNQHEERRMTEQVIAAVDNFMCLINNL